MTHIHYKSTGKVHSFRGYLVDGAQDKIDIQGPTGDRAWRITKFEVMPNYPGGATQEAVLQVWREEQATLVTSGARINFDEDELLAAAYYVQYGLPAQGQNAAIITFDNALFVRNIWVTFTDNDSDLTFFNYYIELEEVKVAKAGMAQLSLAAARRVQTDV
jgi:hypothetical protein